MSKRQTTGMPDKRRITSKETEQKPSYLDRVLGNPESRIEREEALNSLVVKSVTVIAVVIVVLVGITFFYDQVIVPNQTVATVNGEAITVAQFRERIRFERVRLSQDVNNIVAQAQAFGIDANQFLQQEPYVSWVNELQFPDQLGQRVLDDMVDDKLASQEAQKLGISVDDSAVQDRINSFFGYDPTQVASIGLEPTATLVPTETPTPFVSPTPSPTPLPTATPTPAPESTAEATEEATALPTVPPAPTQSAQERQSQFEQNVRDFRSGIRQNALVSDSVIDDYFKRQALQRAVGLSLLSEGNKTTYVNVRHILVATEEQALDIVEALKNGESFADLARALSTDTGSGSNGGELDWAPAYQYVPEFKQASLTLEIGAISDPVQTQFGYHILQVRAREEREVSGSDLDNAASALYTEWLTNLRTTNESNIVINSNWTDYVPR